MEINRFEDVLGVKTQEAVVEGRFVALTEQAFNGLILNVDDDLPGAHVPATAEEAKRAKYCLAFAQDNRPAPIVDYPGVDYDFRGGFVNSNSGPLSVTMYLTHPGNQEGMTVASGVKALAFTEATVTLPSGAYVYDANLIKPGAAWIVADVATDGATDAGKPKYLAADAVGRAGIVETYDADTQRLTLRVRE